MIRSKKPVSTCASLKVSIVAHPHARIVPTAIKPLSSFPATMPEGGISRVLIALRGTLSNIPAGMYCFDNKGVCPHLCFDQTRRDYEYGYCSLSGHSDWNAEHTSLLWDQCKECSLKLEHDDCYPLGPISNGGENSG